jgi:phthiodiolone/phenolphthiodiolone dimycocerosates ketoreductase
MLRATGRYADAWFPALLSMRPKDYARGLEAVRTAATDAGRDPMSITPAVSLFVVTGRSGDEVDETLASDAAKAMALNVPADMWRSHGVEHPLGQDFSGGQDLVPQTFDEQTVLSYVRQVPVSLLKDALLTGTPEEVIGQAAEWRDHGLRYLVLCNISILQPSLPKSLAASASFFRILRGLKKL